MGMHKEIDYVSMSMMNRKKMTQEYKSDSYVIHV